MIKFRFFSPWHPSIFLFKSCLSYWGFLKAEMLLHTIVYICKSDKDWILSTLDGKCTPRLSTLCKFSYGHLRWEYASISGSFASVSFFFFFVRFYFTARIVHDNLLPSPGMPVLLRTLIIEYHRMGVMRNLLLYPFCLCQNRG